MPKRVRTGLVRTDILKRYIERFRKQLGLFQPFLSRKRSATPLDTFDDAAEELIGQVYGQASDELEAYIYAKTGETPMVPEEAQDHSMQNIERESLHQRRQVQRCPFICNPDKDIIARSQGFRCYYACSSNTDIGKFYYLSKNHLCINIHTFSVNLLYRLLFA